MSLVKLNQWNIYLVPDPLVGPRRLVLLDSGQRNGAILPSVVEYVLPRPASSQAMHNTEVVQSGTDRIKDRFDFCFSYIR